MMAKLRNIFRNLRRSRDANGYVALFVTEGDRIRTAADTSPDRMMHAVLVIARTDKHHLEPWEIQTFNSTLNYQDAISRVSVSNMATCTRNRAW